MKKKSRLVHVLGCCRTAMNIARKNGLCRKTVFRAALLHDYTKNYSREKQLAVFEKYGYVLDPETETMPQLWHAISASLIAENVFRQPASVCSAIRWHTTGRAGMNAEEAAVYVADMIEPSRSFNGVEALRSAADADLLQGLQTCLQRSITFLEEKGSPVHSDTLKTYEWCKTITTLDRSEA